VQTRRLVEYDRVRQQALDGHRSIKHGVKLAGLHSQKLGHKRHSLGLLRQTC
jgi:hypothetical protein